MPARACSTGLTAPTEPTGAPSGWGGTLQASEHPSAEQVRGAVATTLRRLGTAGCSARLAAEFGDHPELAAARMAWALATIRDDYRTPDSLPPLALALAG